MWLERPEQWDKLAEYLRKAGEFGYDTETYGQPDKTSPQHRARIHCWSVGILTNVWSPRGFRRAVGRVLPRDALQHPSIRDVFGDPSIRLWAHNAPHDRHSTENEGVEVRGLEDSLQWARVALPGRKDYGLKDMERWALGYESRPSFLEMVSYDATVVHQRPRVVRACVCGKDPCRARSTSEWCDVNGNWQPHTRIDRTVYTPVERIEHRRYAVTDFVPGAEMVPLTWTATKDKPTPPVWWQGKPIDRLAAWWDYSLFDAVRGMELVDYLRGLKPAKVEYPWAVTK